MRRPASKPYEPPRHDQPGHFAPGVAGPAGYDPAKHPRGSGGKFGSKPDAQAEEVAAISRAGHGIAIQGGVTQGGD